MLVNRVFDPSYPAMVWPFSVTAFEQAESEWKVRTHKVLSVSITCAQMLVAQPQIVNRTAYVSASHGDNCNTRILEPYWKSEVTTG